jgi:hypothetical protein
MVLGQKENEKEEKQDRPLKRRDDKDDLRTEA